MTWQPTNWRQPRTGDAPIRVKFRNGDLSKAAHPAAKWNWSNRNYDYDITHWKEEN